MAGRWHGAEPGLERAARYGLACALGQRMSRSRWAAGLGGSPSRRSVAPGGFRRRVGQQAAEQRG
ncbi:hypothetical protein ABMX48_00020 [Streptomyces cavourensis]